jgi:hypothetical protein
MGIKRLPDRLKRGDSCFYQFVSRTEITDVNLASHETKNDSAA